MVSTKVNVMCFTQLIFQERPVIRCTQCCPRPSGLPKEQWRKSPYPLTQEGSLLTLHGCTYLCEESSRVRKKHTSENDHGASDIRILFGAGSPETKCFPARCEPASHSRALTGVERYKQDPERAFTCLREEGALGGRGCEDTVFRSPFFSRKD